MSLRAFSLGDAKDSGELRFQDLTEDEQDRIIKAFKNGLDPDINHPQLTFDIVWRWYVDVAIYKFWVENREVRGGISSKRRSPKSAR